uniref:NADH dehydrogenase subunit 6 n=1 Tax=Neelides sp. FZ-2019 TaxID=2583951 RepID=A0A6H0EYH0_9HEXA|nr:NADH dehydrogenase subunit 6 [Neelides sp. FZ-2019]
MSWIKLMLILMTMISMSSLMFHSPMITLASILLQSIFVCSILATMNATPYFSYILFLIFFGAMMILFIYITSLASNEINTKINLNLNSIILFLTLILLIIFLIYNQHPMNNSLMMNHLTSIKMIFSLNAIFTTLTTMIFLLLTLLVVCSLCFSKTMPLRAHNKI